MLNRFCLLSKPLPPVLNANGQNQDGWNTNQNQLKNTNLFHIVFEVLKVLFIKICKMQPLDLLFLVALLVWSQVARSSSDQDGEAGFTKSKKHYLLQFILTNFMK